MSDAACDDASMGWSNVPMQEEQIAARMAVLEERSEALHQEAQRQAAQRQEAQRQEAAVESVNVLTGCLYSKSGEPFSVQLIQKNCADPDLRGQSKTRVLSIPTPSEGFGTHAKFLCTIYKDMGKENVYYLSPKSLYPIFVDEVDAFVSEGKWTMIKFFQVK